MSSPTVDAPPRDPAPVTLWSRGRGRRLNVCLVRPPVVTLPGSLATHGPVPPLGLAYIAAVLRDLEHRVEVIDAPMAELGRTDRIESPVGDLDRVGLSPHEIVERMDPGTEVVGITNMFLHEWPQVREIAERARARFPDALIVVGGETPTALHERLLDECPAVDCCVIGEGERTIAELLERWAGDVDLGDLASVAMRPGSRAGAGPAHGLPVRIRTLDSVPRPAWDLFPLANYWESTPFLGVDLGRSMPMIATRGCPYKCSFCSSPSMWTTRYVVRDPADVVDEIAGYVEHYGVRNVNFCDLTAITKRRWTLSFCDELDARGLDITWQLPVGTRSEALDAEVLQRLHDTGCRNITYAPETGSKHMLEVFDKRVDLGNMLRSVRTAHRIGIHTHVNIIIGHPAETRRDVLASVWLLVRAAAIGCDDAAPSIFSPYPGSRDHRELVEADQLTLDDIYYTGFARSTKASRSFNPRFSARQLRIVQLGMLAVFYGLAVLRRPVRLVRLVWTPFFGGERTYLEQMLRTRRAVRSTSPRRARWAGVRRMQP